MALGERLLALCESAQGEVLIVAPFMKTGAVRRLLDAVPSAVPRLRFVTRWRPEEVTAGVTDLEVMDLVVARGGSLLLHPCLHAKIYRADARCLIGSANVTDRALGWSAPPNLEFLHEVEAGAVAAFEAELFQDAIVATSEIKDAVAAAADALRHLSTPSREDDGVALPRPETPIIWLPCCSMPERLYNVYTNVETWRLVDSALEAGRRDLEALRVPPGLPHGAFTAFVAAALFQMPVVRKLDEAARRGLTDDAAIKLIRAEVPEADAPYGNAALAWDVLKSWLVMFGAGRYRERPAGAELVRSRKL